MKGVFLILGLLMIFALGTGCRTVPRHLAQEEVVIYYPVEYPVLDPIYIGGPHPLPPPTSPVPRPVITNPVPPRDPQPKNPNDGGSYNQRDSLQGGGNRNPGETKTYPPVKIPVQNDRVQ